MNMKSHILTALREQFAQWEVLLESLNEGQSISPAFDLDWSIKDVITHLWGWQQISIARMKAGAQGGEPVFPNWLLEFPEWDESAKLTNNWMHTNFHQRSWVEAHQKWKEGYALLIDLGEQITERDLLDSDRYPWLKGYSLAFILVASYEHHQEHFDKLTAWLSENRKP